MEADLADMQLTSKYKKENYVFIMRNWIFSKYAWVVPLKDKKGVTIVNAFQNISDNSKNQKAKQNMGWSREWIL